MFVSSPSDRHLAFPAKPKPLLPIFTFAQSQSCMNLRLDMESQDFQDWGSSASFCPDIYLSRSGLDLERPPGVYSSPLQRIGEALRTQQRAPSDPSCNAPSSTPRTTPQISTEGTAEVWKHTNYSHKLPRDPLPDPSVPESRPMKQAARGDQRKHGDSAETGTIIDSAARARAQTPQSRGYFAGTSLLSSFFSNPRTRAPFKPQKASRGTSSWQLKQYAEATLGSGSLRKAVKLPEGEDKDEWLAVNGARQRCEQHEHY